MPKWAERAKAAMGHSGSNSFQRASLDETVAQGKQILSDIRFTMESSGASADAVALNVAGLNRVEDFYRAEVRKNGGSSIAFGKENFERLMSVMLGECVIESCGGGWVVYQGNQHVLDPVVVRLPSERHLDVFLFCRDLSKKQAVTGANTSKALSSFVKNAEQMAFP